MMKLMDTVLAVFNSSLFIPIASALLVVLIVLYSILWKRNTDLANKCKEAGYSFTYDNVDLSPMSTRFILDNFSVKYDHINKIAQLRYRLCRR